MYYELTITGFLVVSAPVPTSGSTLLTGLLVQGQDLLEWAAMSSREYFELRHLQESEVGNTVGGHRCRRFSLVLDPALSNPHEPKSFFFIVLLEVVPGDRPLLYVAPVYSSIATLVVVRGA